MQTHDMQKKTLGYQLDRVLNANMGCAPTTSIFFLLSLSATILADENGPKLFCVT